MVHCIIPVIVKSYWIEVFKDSNILLRTGFGSLEKHKGLARFSGGGVKTKQHLRFLSLLCIVVRYLRS